MQPEVVPFGSEMHVQFWECNPVSTELFMDRFDICMGRQAKMIHMCQSYQATTLGIMR